VTAGGNDTITTGGSTTINYRITANNGDNQTGCNAADSSAATLNVNAPANVTATPSSRTFTTCGTNQSVQFSSNTAGTYTITVSVSDSGTGTYNTSPATFTLKVNNPPPPTNTPPTLTLPGPQTVQATGPNGAVFNYNATASDAQDDPDPTPTATLPRRPLVPTAPTSTTPHRGQPTRSMVPEPQPACQLLTPSSTWARLRSPATPLMLRVTRLIPPPSP
jgi:hypothetical protein